MYDVIYASVGRISRVYMQRTTTSPWRLTLATPEPSYPSFPLSLVKPQGRDMLLVHTGSVHMHLTCIVYAYGFHQVGNIQPAPTVLSNMQDADTNSISGLAETTVK